MHAPLPVLIVPLLLLLPWGAARALVPVLLPPSNRHPTNIEGAAKAHSNCIESASNPHPTAVTDRDHSHLWRLQNKRSLDLAMRRIADSLRQVRALISPASYRPSREIQIHQTAHILLRRLLIYAEIGPRLFSPRQYPFESRLELLSRAEQAALDRRLGETRERPDLLVAAAVEILERDDLAHVFNVRPGRTDRLTDDAFEDIRRSVEQHEREIVDRESMRRRLDHLRAAYEPNAIGLSVALALPLPGWAPGEGSLRAPRS